MKSLIVLFVCLFLTSCMEKVEDNKAVSESQSEEKPSMLVCTKELKICPDGSGVGRNSENNCEFDACPKVKAGGSQKPAACSEEIKQCPDGSFVSRDPLNGCEFKACGNSPAAKKGEPMMCTQEVKECPDGSFVGRDSYNNCAFKPCPKDGANLQ